MAGIGLCKNKECINKNNCKRFKDTVGEDFYFNNICNEENNYKWLWKIENSVTKVNNETNNKESEV